MPYRLRKKDDALKQALLTSAIRTECIEGVNAISIRRLAAETYIAVGTVYNYFESKQEVLLALTEAYWENAIKEMQEQVKEERFQTQLERIISFLRSKMNDCAEILMRSLHEDADLGRERMASMQHMLRQALIKRLSRDAAIAERVWSESLTKEMFADFVLSNPISLLQREVLNKHLI